MKFRYTILYVHDVGEAVAFYERACGLRRRFVHEGGQYTEMDTGATVLAFVSVELARSNLPDGFRENDPGEPPPGVEIAFTTQDVQAAFRVAVEAGATKVAEPAVKPWGQTVAYVRDRDGILVEIASEK